MIPHYGAIRTFPQLPWEFPVVGRAAMFLLGIVLDVRGKTTFLK